MKQYPRLVIAGTSSGFGKTTATLVILAALRERGRRVQPFKAGPDFIDPGHHRAVTGRPSRNLDGWMLGADCNRAIFAQAATDADLSIIEGMMGLFDGSLPVNDIGSTAELAKQLEAPVILVIDGSAMARSAAAMVAGYARFDPALRVVGVLFNRVGSDGHYQLLKAAVEQETDVATLGYLSSDAAITIPDRHLGLVMAMEQGDGQLYHRLAKAALDTVDLDRIEALAHLSGMLPEDGFASVIKNQGRAVRIGVAQDQAFCFYYPDNLDLLESAGAEIVPFSPVNDPVLPDVEMLYLGGGYPELHAEVLAKNIAMRTGIKRFADQGGVIYAECGGLMYLTESICNCDGHSHDMVGVFPAETVMRKPGFTLGYRTVECSRGCLIGDFGATARGHEFHYSRLVPNGPLTYACTLSDAEGLSKGQDGLTIGNVLALYTHLHFASQPTIAARLIDSARRLAAESSVIPAG
ncbi:MAG: cobyrinate a,c-diamide synthase [Nitrospira sp.]|nr:cobyrinate a,c-diamide synthase [Nitrospira sp.]MDH4368736.1 cobyrinate a,c-diamide synthase [Nitrospira sp.]MDH5348366.1 cobyrinate a,c-diamide synthase [Nitrospira sp.]MDH5497975.1 cobyrinate a,c-diamide synthase [Nitrospira sp.]MDH5725370.1 cobyrinate a,c-diamide synthase [Nitrospira sp.]